MVSRKGKCRVLLSHQTRQAKPDSSNNTNPTKNAGARNLCRRHHVLVS
jgi:hypothetical protein